MKMKIFYGNKSSSSLENVRCTVRDQSSVVVQLSPSDAFTVEGKEQKPQLAKIDMMRPFTEPPTMDLEFKQSGQDYKVAIRLRVIIRQFVSPYPCEAAQFKTFWGKYTIESREIVTFAEDVDSKQVLGDLPSIFHMARVDMPGAAASLSSGMAPSSRTGRR